MGSKYLILACDGGGIRGLFTAKMIERLQAEVPFLDQVELYAGTSTGGIIALGLADGKTPAELVDLYRDRGAEIFDNSGPKPPPIAGAPDWLNDLIGRVDGAFQSMDDWQHGFNHPKYPNEGLARVLTDTFGGRTLRDIRTGKSALVTTLRLASGDGMWAPRVLHNIGPDDAATPNTRVQDGPTRGTKLVDACLATSAAPLFFPPHEHPEFGYCVDGGLVANCPSSIALALALRDRPGIFDQIRVLSIGTGVQISGIDVRHSSPFDVPSAYGALAWMYPFSRGRTLPGGDQLTPAFPLVSALFDASSAAHNYIAQQALGDQYCRVQVVLDRSVALDDVRPATLDLLEHAADTIPAATWEQAVAWLKAQLA